MTPRFLSKIARGAMATVLSTVALVSTSAMHAQAKALVTTAIDERQTVQLKGNVARQLRTAKDLGEADRSKPAGRIIVVLKRPEEQEKALQSFLMEAHQKTSAGYHKWLTPAAFGKQFGAADSDVQQLTGWLQAHGLTVAKVSNGRNMVEFSGTIGQVEDTFRTTIHQYSVTNAKSGKAETHYGNATDPSVPAAFGKLVAGVTQLNDFKPIPAIKVMGRASYNVKKHTGVPQWTYPEGPGYAPYYFLAPEDFSTQYDVKPVYAAGTTGAGQTIGIINDSNIDLALVNAYRKLFGLPANAPQVIIDGNDPGITGDSGEAYLDVENAGSIAPAATVNLYIAGYTGLLGEGGLGFSLLRAVDDDAASVLSLSFGYCEAGLGTAGNSFYNELWEQAAAQGQTVMVATGDSGSVGFGCGYGLGINGLGSTPWNVAVGGTDAYLSDYASGGASIATFFNSTNDANLGSLQTKFQEQPWDGTQFGLNSTLYSPVEYQPEDTGAGGGGPSTCAYGGDTFDPNTGLPICTGGYAKPIWQVAPGVPSDGVRDVPDVSLFASNGYNGVLWPMCAEEGDCTETDPATGNTFITGVGGTSASSPAMAGIMALVNQKYGPQGQADFTLYPLAVQFPAVFNDVTVGSINEPCSAEDVGYTFGCALDSDGDGFYSYQGYSAGPGYDLATGLGSIDVNQLITNWGSITFKSTSTTLSLSPTTITHGANVTASVAVTGTGTPTGVVGIVTSTTLPNNKGITGIPLTDGTGSEAIGYLPGGTYTVTGNYSGDGVNAASSSTPVSITVNAEVSTLGFAPVYVDPNTGNGTGIPAGATVPYGANILLDVTVLDAAGQQDGYGTGTVTFTDGSTTLATVNVSAAGTAEFNGSLLAVGAHTITAAYSGDPSYKASSTSPLSFTVGQSATSTLIFADYTATYNADNSIGYVAGQSANITALVYTSVQAGLYPTGSVTFQLGSATPVTVPLNPDNDLLYIDASTASAVFSNLALGTQTLTVKYSGDANYAASTSSQVIEVTAPTLPLTTTTLTISPSNVTNIPPSTIITATATVTGSSTSAPTGTASFTLGNFLTFNPVTLTPGAGNTSTAVLTIRAADLLPGANLMSVTYSGSAVYSPSTSSSSLVNDDPSDFTLQSQTTTLVLNSGTSASFSLNLASLNGFNGTVALTCTAATGMVCVPSPASVSLNGNTTASVTIGTVTHTYSMVHGQPGWGETAAGTMLACLLCVIVPKRRRFGRVLLSMMVVVALMAGVSGCSPNSKELSTPSAPIDLAPGTYSVVITGTGSNGLVHNTVISVVVQ
jgi:subtilase family serine protease